MPNSVKSAKVQTEYLRPSSRKLSAPEKAAELKRPVVSSPFTEEERREMGRICTLNLIENLDKVEF